MEADDAGIAGGPGLGVWEDAPTAPWAQLERRLSSAPEVQSLLMARLQQEVSLVDHIEDLTMPGSKRGSNSTWFAAHWLPGDVPVLVKLNVTPHERHWMATM